MPSSYHLHLLQIYFSTNFKNIDGESSLVELYNSELYQKMPSYKLSSNTVNFIKKSYSAYKTMDLLSSNYILHLNYRKWIPPNLLYVYKLFIRIPEFFNKKCFKIYVISIS